MESKKKYTLVGVDGNAFAVMGYVIRCMEKEGRSIEQIEEYRKDATSSNYDHLLSVSVAMITKLNKDI